MIDSAPSSLVVVCTQLRRQTKRRLLGRNLLRAIFVLLIGDFIVYSYEVLQFWILDGGGKQKRQLVGKTEVKLQPYLLFLHHYGTDIARDPAFRQQSTHPTSFGHPTFEALCELNPSLLTSSSVGRCNHQCLAFGFSLVKTKQCPLSSFLLPRKHRNHRSSGLAISSTSRRLREEPNIGVHVPPAKPNTSQPS